jgi:hypothetical protein
MVHSTKSFIRRNWRIWGKPHSTQYTRGRDINPGLPLKKRNITHSIARGIISCQSHYIIFNQSEQITLFLSSHFQDNPSQISVITRKQTPSLQSNPKASLDLWNTTVGNRIELKSRDTRAIPIKSATHNHRCSMVYTKYDNNNNIGLGSSSALLPRGSTATSSADARGLLYYSPYYF